MQGGTQLLALEQQLRCSNSANIAKHRRGGTACHFQKPQGWELTLMLLEITFI